MRSSHTRPVCRPRLENFEDRLAPNNMLSVTDALAASPAASGLSGWTPADLFGVRPAQTALAAFVNGPQQAGRPADPVAPVPASGPLEAANPLARRMVTADSLDSLAGTDMGGGDGGAGIQSDDGVFPPDSRPYGRSYAQWAANWWQWSMGIPTARSPLTDTTGQFAGVGQAGRVFYLAGTWGNLGPITRTVSVAEGKALFIPVVNSFFFNGPGESFTVPEMRAALRPGIDGATNLRLTVDGTAINLSGFRVESSVFTLHLPADNFFAEFGVPAGNYRPAVADGIHVMLAPLEEGTHRIRIQGAIPSFGLTMDVTYQLTVEDD